MHAASNTPGEKKNAFRIFARWFIGKSSLEEVGVGRAIMY
jgi:hypothetical protein